MEGLNYEFQCHHAADVFDEIFMCDAPIGTSYISNESNDRVDLSPRSAVTSQGCNKSLYLEVDCDDNENMRYKALDIAQRANIFSDVPFLYSPCDIAFAIAAIVSGSVRSDSYCIRSKLVHLYHGMYPEKSHDHIVSTLRKVILSLLNCQKMDLYPIMVPTSRRIVAERAEELRRILGEVATLRLLRKMNRFVLLGRRYTRDVVLPSTLSDTRAHVLRKRNRFSATRREDNTTLYHSSKRKRTDTEFTPPRLVRTCARITPTNIQANANY